MGKPSKKNSLNYVKQGVSWDWMTKKIPERRRSERKKEGELRNNKKGVLLLGNSQTHALFGLICNMEDIFWGVARRWYVHLGLEWSFVNCLWFYGGLVCSNLKNIKHTTKANVSARQAPQNRKKGNNREGQVIWESNLHWKPQNKPYQPLMRA